MDFRIPVLCCLASFAIIAIMVHWVWGVIGLGAVAVVEFFFRLLRRRFLVCPICEFDPYLYARDITAARTKVQTKINERMAKREPSNLQKINKEPPNIGPNQL